MASANKKIIIITAPSGAGKTSITRYLLERFPQLSFSISATTRSPRENEVDGKDYYFISIDAFKQKNTKRRICGVGNGVRRQILRYLENRISTPLEKKKNVRFWILMLKALSTSSNNILTVPYRFLLSLHP